MNPLERLNGYLGRIERRLRLVVLSRGAALLAGSALLVTVLAVLVANRFAFSAPSVLVARLLLFSGLALAIGSGLAFPLIRLNRSRAARQAERSYPELEQRLVTFAEAGRREPHPFLDLLAADTLETIERAGADRIRTRPWILGFTSAAAAALGTLLWLVAAGPGFLGYGAALLWAGSPKAGGQPFYDVIVSPGDATIRRKADQLITARLVGFDAQRVRLSARYRGASRWEEAFMRPQPGGSGYELLLAGVPDSLEYYVEAGRIRSSVYTIHVIDLPGIKRIRVTYRYPQWTGLPAATEEPGGDLRAVQGTEAEIAVETDRPFGQGFLVLDDGARIPLDGGAGNWRTARLSIRKDGLYYIAARERAGPAEDQLIRLSEDFIIEARKDSAPALRLVRPGRDTRVSPIEEVTVAVEAEDDFGLQTLELRYSVNAGPEKTVSLLDRKGARQSEAQTTLYLEDFKLAPGDVVSLYATARDARNSVQTDMCFLEAQPFEREYTQSQQAGGGSGAGGEQEDSRIAERQKEIIAATWNQIREKSNEAETASFLAGVQAKLRDQARSLANRMRSRELSRANQEFQSFSEEMGKAAEAMTAAADKLKSAAWPEALQPEQKALQHLLRAEATLRKIQVAFGDRGGRGGGRGGMGRDLENLFDLELDTEKNQYETGQRAGPQTAQQRELDEAFQKLEQLARRQQELASRPQSRQSFEQRWQQEILRREAEQLRQRMEQLSRGGAPSQAGQQGAETADSAADESQRERLRSMARPAVDPRVRQALDKLAQAARDMGRPGSGQRAAEQLRQARDLLGGMRRQEATAQVEDMTRRSEQLAGRQQDFASRLRRLYGDPTGVQPRPDRQDAERLSAEKRQMTADLERLERDLQQGVRDLASSQRGASSRMREALGDLQQQELALRMKYNAELIRRGLGAYAIMREAPVTAGLQNLRDQLREAQTALNRTPGGRQQGNLEQALNQLERARQRLESAGQPGETARELAQLGRALREAPEIARAVEDLAREMLAWNFGPARGNPALLERMRVQFLPGLDRIELQLRRQLGQPEPGQARSGASERIPPGYADAVAEYYRRLSKGR